MGNFENVLKKNFLILLCFVFPIFVLVAGPENSYGKDMETLKEQSKAFQLMRNDLGHFNGGKWNAAVDQWMGKKHVLMQKLAEGMVENRVTQSKMLEWIGPADQNSNKGDFFFEQIVKSHDHQHLASVAQNVLVFYWRGQHDFLFFAFDGERLIQSGWWHAYE